MVGGRRIGRKRRIDLGLWLYVVKVRVFLSILRAFLSKNIYLKTDCI